MDTIEAMTPLPALLRRPFELLFGADLRSVRLHPDSPAAVALDARAFAWRDEIHFAPGDYDPFSSDGWSTLGHEVAHVIQQRCGRVPRRPWLKPLHDTRLEHEANLAGCAAAAMYESKRPPLLPLFGGGVPSRHEGGCAIQCLMDEKAFEMATDAPGLRNKIKPVAAALRQFHNLNNVTPRDYVAILGQLRALYAACNNYTQQRPDSKRLGGVNALMKQIAAEEAFLAPLADFSRAADEIEQFKHLERAQELALQFMHRAASFPDFARAKVDKEVLDLITKHGNTMRHAGRAGEAVQYDLDELIKLVDRATLPRILRSVITECTNAANTRQLDKKIGLPGAVYNTANGATQKYMLNHATEQYLGKKFRLGSLLHELTHISIAETFDNTVVMLAIKKTATDDEMLALARQRRLNIAGLQHLLTTSPGIANAGSMLKNECIDKAGYATGIKIFGYLTFFKARLGEPTFQRLKSLLEGHGMRSELVEYDTVINQMALWCHLWGVNENDPAYHHLLTLVDEAYTYRANHRHAATLPLAVPIVVRAEPTRPANRRSMSITETANAKPPTIPRTGSF